MNPVVQSCKALRPPVYPKYEKASTVKLNLPRNTPIPHANKIQREDINSLGGPQSTPSSTYPPSLIPTASPMPSDAGSLAHQQQCRQEYHQFSRKNYFKTRRNIEQTQLQSRLTEKVLPTSRSPSHDDQKRLKSKSALSYAKYFIKHVSIIPTEPSSNPPALPNEDTPQCPEEQPKRNNETSLQKKSNSIFSHQDRQKSRKKISERLKSIKNTRSKGNKPPCSIQKGGKQVREERRTPVKPAKIAGNICSIQSNQSNVLRMKARARNKRIILKVKQYHSRVPEEDLCLMVSSKIDRSFSDRREIVQRVELHLELLNLLPAYVKEFKEIYEEAECWEELVFLAYKKFYIQRLKVQLALSDEQRTNEDLSCSNPFRFNFCSVSDKDLDSFRNSLQCLRLQQKLASENASIKQALRNLYNHIIEKSGKHVNLYQVDNFSQEIYYLMNEQLKLLTENEIDSLQAVRERRIGFIIKCCLLVAFLNGENVQVDSVLAQNTCTQRMKDTYHAFIQYYTA